MVTGRCPAIRTRTVNDFRPIVALSPSSKVRSPGVATVVTAVKEHVPMNLRAIMASLPLLKRAWRWLPGPLRIPVLLIAVVVGVWRFFSGRNDSDDRGRSPSATDGSSDGSATINR
jgi:hypothetical protein